jgi:hypothetical protein
LPKALDSFERCLATPSPEITLVLAVRSEFGSNGAERRALYAQSRAFRRHGLMQKFYERVVATALVESYAECAGYRVVQEAAN